jgi:hypothetical protein
VLLVKGLVVVSVVLVDFVSAGVGEGVKTGVFDEGLSPPPELAGVGDGVCAMEFKKHRNRIRRTEKTFMKPPNLCMNWL